jgi:phage terminase small subunit
MPVLKNPRHELFAQYIALGKNATEAYATAGFSPGKDGNRSRGAAQSASRLLRGAAVRVRIDELTTQAGQSRSTKAWFDREFVIENLKRNLERAMQQEPVRDSQGNPTGEYRYNGNVANKALELLGRELGMFVERTMEVKDPLDYKPEDWDALMARFAAKHGVPLEVLEMAADDLTRSGTDPDKAQ